MSIFGWIIIGAIAGWIGSKFTGNSKHMGLVANLVVGVIGAFVGGFVFTAIGGKGFTGFDLWSLLVAVVGSIILLTIINLIRK